MVLSFIENNRPPPAPARDDTQGDHGGTVYARLHVM